MAEFVELGITGFDKLVDKHGETGYERVQAYNPLSSRYKKKQSQTQDSQSDYEERQSSTSRRRSSKSPKGPHRHRATLPSPEREDYYYNDRDFERQSETSERVLRNYENERDDPRRKPDPSLTRSNKMSYGYDDRRPSSQGRSRYDDGDSDYDEHTGRRHRSSGRGYDDRRSGDYDREIIETEVYKGPPRDWGNQRSPSFQGETGEYAVAPYRGSNDNLAPYDNKRRSRSHHGRDRDEYDDRDRERSRSRGEKIRDKLENTFDGSARGLGAGLVGAVVGGLAAKQFGDKRHNTRDMVIGAVVGGLAVNAAEQKYTEWKRDKDEDKYEGRYDDRDYRSRSAMR